jgi:hypothetical protein
MIDKEIPLSLSLEDFKNFFRSKQERTASSPSGRHFGHYKTLLECIRNKNSIIPQLIIDVAYISLSTASPLHRWQVASQVMLEKGKGHYIYHFVLHVIWGHRLIRHATHHSALKSQFANPGQTCNNAVLNKVLFYNLSRQSLSPGVLTDFNATAAFDRVIGTLSIATCKSAGLPIIAGHFTYLLLKNMQFHLLTGFGKSSTSYNNQEEDMFGQGVLQGSSSAVPMFILNSDVTLSA